MSEVRPLILLMLLIVLAGTWIRFDALGSTALSEAELPYHYAALQYSQEGASAKSANAIPPGADAARGGPMIRAIGIAQKFFRNNELAVRLPSAMIGSVTIVLFGAIVWLIAGPWAAVVATFLLAFFPEAVRQSRTASLYSSQLFFGVIALGAGWLATAHAGPRQSSSPVDLIRRWIWALICVGAFVVAGRLHLSAGTVLLAFMIWMVLLAAAAIWISGVASLKNNLAVQFVILGIVSAIALFFIKPDILHAIWWKISGPPAPGPLTDNVPQNGWFYIFNYSSQFGWAFTLLPLLILVTIRKYTWLTAYLLIWFFVPLVAHSFFIVRKEERLLLLAAPALFFLAGIAFSEGRARLVDALNFHAREWLATYRSTVRATNSVVWVVALFALLTVPALVMSLRIPRARAVTTTADWQALRSIVDQTSDAQFLPVGSSAPFSSYMYLGKSDYAVGEFLGAVPSETQTKLAEHRIRPAVDTLRREAQTGALLLRNITELRDAYSPYGDIFFVFDSRVVDYQRVDPSFWAAFAQNSTELCVNRCGSLRLYRVRLSRDTLGK